MSVGIEQLKQIYQNILPAAYNSPKTPKLKIEFYPYVGINNKIRLKEDLIHVKLSDILQDAPLEFHKALAEILVKKLYRKRISSKTLEIYQNYIKQGEIREKSLETRKTRGRKILNGSQGKHYDLEEFFLVLNEMYFENSIPKPNLTWSSKDTYRILGHYDPSHQTISISKSLDDLRVPPYVVSYVVYHEMLHIKHPTRYENGRRYIHTPAFRRDEREFSDFEEAEEWIERHWGEISSAKKQKGKRTKSFLRRLLDF